LLGLGIVAAAAGQGAPLNIADNPIDLNGNYMCPGANGYARANTNPNDRFTLTQVVEMSGSFFAKSGTFTPFNDLTKWPARMTVDLTGKAYQFDIDLDAASPKVNWENAVFAIGAGDELGSTMAAAAQVEISRNGSTWDFKWRSGPGSTTPVVTISPASPLPTQFRVRVLINSGPLTPATATVVITPLNNVTTPVDTVVVGLPVNVPVTNTPFVAGFQAVDGMSTSRGHAVVKNFVTTAGPNAMWMMDQGAYKSTNPAAAPGSLLPAQYVIGMSNPTERVHAWQAIIDPINFFLSTDFSIGMPVFNMPMIAPFNGTLDNPIPPYPFLPRGIVRAGAFSIIGTPSGTEQSYFLGALNFNILDGENFQRPAFVATDPAGGPAPAITTLQGSGYTNIPSNLREASGLIIDNSRPFTSQLRVFQDMATNPSVLHQGPVTIAFRGEDFGLPGWFNLGSGLARYPRRAPPGREYVECRRRSNR
jgi:hypothetical protein